MTEDEKLIFLYEEVNGKLREGGRCYWEVKPPVDYAGKVVDCEAEDVLHCMKDGNSCWTKSKTEILFDYVTRNL